MNLDELRTVQATERQKDSLQHLRPSFYHEVGEYIADLEAERDRIADSVDDPFSSPEVSRLTDEIETAKDVVEAVYERRMGKLVKQASLAAAGMPADDEGLTAEEQDLFDDLVSSIESNKTRVLEVLAGEIQPDTVTDGQNTEPQTDLDRPEPDRADPNRSETNRADPAARADDTSAVPPQEPQAEPVERSEPPTVTEDDTEPATDGVTAADVMGDGPSARDNTAEAKSNAGTGDGGTDSGYAVTEPGVESESDRPESDRDDRDGSRSGGGMETTPSESPPARTDDAVERVTVRITEDVGAILGVDDREYTLVSNDVVTLPEQNASPLLERDAAEPLE